jgi:hypothetical protein
VEKFPWSLVVTVVGALMSLIGALILYNLQSIKACVRKVTERLDKQDSAIDKQNDNIASIKESNDVLVNSLANCKVDCHRNFVTGEAFLRETGFMRRTLETQTASLNRMEGQLTITEKLPEIVGEISRNIVAEMKKG